MKSRSVVRAGAAYLRATENDPDAKAAIPRVRHRLQVFSTAMQELMNSPEYQAAQQAERQRWQELADAIQQTLAATGHELKARHFDQPATIADWEHLARIVEIPTETIRSGDLTAREIFACALAWADRQTIKAKLTADAQESINRSPEANRSGNVDQGDDQVEFRWTVPMLEGYVFAVLRDVEHPTERDAVARIALKSRKREPARATLRKTYAWQNRPQKIRKPRTTNEAQSGVSPAENADAGMSHEEVTHAVLDIEEKLYRQLKDDERAAVAWTLQEAGSDETARDEAIAQLIEGFRSSDM